MPEVADVLPEGESRESIKGEWPPGRRKQRLWAENDKSEMKWGHDMFEKVGRCVYYLVFEEERGKMKMTLGFFLIKINITASNG